MARDLTALATTIAVLAIPLTAVAHSEIVEATPASDETADQGMVRVIAVFSEELGPESSFIVEDSSGEPVDGIDGELDLEDLDHVTLRAEGELSPGIYTVKWTAMSATDGDITNGAWTFTVDAARSATTDAASGGGSAGTTGAQVTSEAMVARGEDATEPGTSSGLVVTATPADSTDDATTATSGLTWLVGLVIVAALVTVIVLLARNRPKDVSRVGVVLLLVATAVVGLSRPASAHGTLDAAEPAEGSVVEDSPDELRLWMSEPVSPRFSSVEIQSLDGRTIPIDGLIVDRQDGRGLLTVDLPLLGDGTYSAAWTVLSESDGHITRGLVVFGVGSGSVGSDSGPVPSAPIAWNEGLIRWAGLVALMAVIGATAVAVFLLWRVPPEFWSAHLLRWCAVWAILGLLAGLALLASQTLALAATLPDGTPLSETASLLVGATDWGTFWTVREILFLLVAMVSALAWGRGVKAAFGVLTVLGIGLLLAQSATSHGAGIAGQAALGVTMDSIHLAGASVWVGGLGSMLLLRRHLQPLPWRRFTGMALVSVGMLVSTGLLNTGLEVESIRAASSSVYGAVLGSKIALFAVVATLGGLNALMLNRAVADRIGRAFGRRTGWQPVDRRHFSKVVVAEAVFGVLVVGATGLLTSLSPARSGSGASSTNVVNAMSDVTDDLTITLTVEPNLPGDNVFVVHAASAIRPAAQEIDRVLLRFSSFDQDLGHITEQMTEVEPGRFRLGGPQFARPGDWAVDVVVRRRGLADSVASFDWVVPVGSPTEDAWGEPLAPLTSLLAAGVLALLVGGIVKWWFGVERVPQSRLGPGAETRSAGGDEELFEEKPMAGVNT